MGVKNLTKFLNEYSANYKSIYDITHYKNSVFVIDVSIYMYIACYNKINKKPNSHIAYFYELFLKLLSNKITPILVFDGKPPEEKHETIIKRKQNENIIIEPTTWSDIKYLCDMFQIKYIISDTESDMICAQIAYNKDNVFILSRDTDMLMHGVNMVFFDGYTYNIIEYNIKNILSDLKLDYNQFVDLCILFGTDYTQKQIFSIGQKQAYNLINYGETLETIIDKYKENVYDKFDEKYQKIRDLVKPKPQIETSELNGLLQFPELSKLNKIDIQKYLHEKCNYMIKTLEKHWLKLIS